MGYFSEEEKVIVRYYPGKGKGLFSLSSYNREKGLWGRGKSIVAM